MLTPQVNDPIEALAKEYGLRVLGSEDNIGIGPAITELVRAASFPVVLFLEKDFEIIESYETVASQLQSAKNLLLSSTNGSRADVVHLRSRWNPGRPISEKHICIPPQEDNGEFNMYPKYFGGRRWDPRLFCNLYRFMNDDELFLQYSSRLVPCCYLFSGIISSSVWRCSDMLCFDSAQCAWTNNPSVFRKQWYLDTLVCSTSILLVLLILNSTRFQSRRTIQRLKVVLIIPLNGFCLIG